VSQHIILQEGGLIMWKKLIVSIFCVVVLVPYVALAQEATVSFDGSSTDIAGQTTTNTAGPWDADDAVWSTTDEVVPAIGSQAAFKAAIAQAGTAQRRIAQAHTNGHVFVGGGSRNAQGAAGHAPSPWANIIGFDTTSFDDSFALSEISVTLRNRNASDTLDVRWFVEAGGQTFVSGVVAAGVGTTNTTVTLADAMAIEWFAFDKTANIEIGTALGGSVGMLALTDVDYVGIHQQLTFTTLQNWHGAYVPQFSATAVPYASTKASRPDPADGATEVLRDAVLGWTPGEFAAATNGHIVYISESFNDVNDATGGVAQDANSYTPPQRLDFGTTYYWRVDEVNTPPDSTVFEGPVWSFTTEPVGYPVTNVTATASSSMPNQGPENTVNGSGLTDDLHGIVPETMWISAFGGPQPTWIQFEFDKVYKLHEMLVWNSNTQFEMGIGYGAKDVSIEYSLDGIDYITLGATHEFNRALGQPDYEYNTVIDMGGLTAKFVRLTVNTNWAAFPFEQYGLSEVRFLHIPVRAREPEPDSGATDVAVEATLAWRAGREASTHSVYLSTDEQAVIDGAVAPVSVMDATYSLPLDLASTYYWRIDEVNDTETPAIWQGDVLNFTTQEYIVVDDFESYNDIPAGEDGSALVYLTWIDGYVDPPAVRTNGSTMGYNEPFQPTIESDNVHSGSQSAPMAYDNSAVAVSEVTRTLAAQDWTGNGIQTLSLWLFGDPTNTPSQLYVKINGVRVNYDGDSTSLSRPLWQRWNIDLASVGTNLRSVTSLAVGVEGAGAAGTLLLDSIRLYPSVPAVEQIFIEAEAGILGASWRSYVDPASSGGQHIGSEDGDGNDNDFAPAAEWRATYSFNAVGGTYKVVLRVQDFGDDSFWVRVPSATSETHEDPDQPGTGWVLLDLTSPEGVWEWKDVESDSHADAVVHWTLPAGTNTIEIAKREDGVWLDAILVTSDVE
jgi:hypothetical protein